MIPVSLKIPPSVPTHTYYTNTHTRTQKKVYAAVIQLLLPSDDTGMPGTTQTLEPRVVNPPGAGLVTRRRTVQVSQIEVVEPKAPQRPHTA